GVNIHPISTISIDRAINQVILDHLNEVRFLPNLGEGMQSDYLAGHEGFFKRGLKFLEPEIALFPFLNEIEQQEQKTETLPHRPFHKPRLLVLVNDAVG